MNVFMATKAINVLYIVGILSISTYNNIIQENPGSSVQDRLIITLFVLFLCTPHIMMLKAIPPKLMLAKTTIVLNLICLVLLLYGLIAHEQKTLALQWGVTVLLICAINIFVLISALVYKNKNNQNLEADVVRDGLL
ncbi:MAG: hypothetical protein CMK89_08885 [Pseudomonadales bacterium]|nr:hypothetical protein [Pseudomonadales bacterium]